MKDDVDKDNLVVQYTDSSKEVSISLHNITHLLNSSTFSIIYL